MTTIGLLNVNLGQLLSTEFSANRQIFFHFQSSFNYSFVDKEIWTVTLTLNVHLVDET